MMKIVFSGGTHCGKTTLIEHYKSLGFTTIPEPGMTFISELVEKIGLQEYKEWRAENKEKFFESLVARQLELEAEASIEGAYNFFDRGIVDTISMAIHTGIPVPQSAIDYAKNNRYDIVFICEILPGFDDRTHTGRVFTLEDSKKIAKIVQEQYVEYGYAPIVLPAVSIEERIDIINKAIGLSQ